MEVFVEDTPGNGMLINGTTLLHRKFVQTGGMAQMGCHEHRKIGGGAGDLASPVSTAKKGAVNVQVTKCHSVNNTKGKHFVCLDYE